MKKITLLIILVTSLGFGQEMSKKKQLVKMSYDSISNIEEYVNKYKVKILKHDGLDYKDYNYLGELYLGDIGFTFKSEIPTLTLIRKGHYYKKELLPRSEGEFILGSSMNDLTTLTISKDKSTGSLSSVQYGKIVTTTFSILD